MAGLVLWPGFVGSGGAALKAAAAAAAIVAVVSEASKRWIGSPGVTCQVDRIA